MLHRQNHHAGVSPNVLTEKRGDNKKPAKICTLKKDGHTCKQAQQGKAGHNCPVKDISKCIGRK